MNKVKRNWNDLLPIMQRIEKKQLFALAKIVLTKQEYLTFVYKYNHGYTPLSIQKRVRTSQYRSRQLVYNVVRKMTNLDVWRLLKMMAK